jgi:hypothetical protein
MIYFLSFGLSRWILQDFEEVLFPSFILIFRELSEPAKKYYFVNKT